MKIRFMTSILTAGALLVSSDGGFADEGGLPAEQVIASIQTALAANPGLIKELDVDKEGGKVIVEVEIISADGKRIEVKVDPEKNQIIR